MEELRRILTVGHAWIDIFLSVMVVGTGYKYFRAIRIMHNK